MSTQASGLRKLLKKRGAIPAIGAWDAMSAKLIEEAGFEAIEVAGGVVSHTMIKKPDLGYITQMEMLEATRRIVDAVSIPVIADVDDGFGDPLHVRRTVQLFEQAGAAGMHIEDNAFPKRCPHLGKGRLIPKAKMITKVKIAVDARKDSDFLIIGRTDKHEGISLDESIERVNAYVEAGADMGFIVGINAAEEAKRASKEIPVPLCYYQAEGQKLVLPLSGLESLGFKIIFYFLSAYTPAYIAARDALRNLKQGLEDNTKVPPLGGRWDDHIYLEKLAGLDEEARLQERFPD